MIFVAVVSVTLLRGGGVELSQVKGLAKFYAPFFSIHALLSTHSLLLSVRQSFSEF